VSGTALIENIGNAVVSFSAMTTALPFTLESDCPLNLLPGSACTLRFGFSSPVTGDFHELATIASNAVGGPVQIALSARAVPAPVPIVRVSPTLIGFGDRIIGSASPPQRVIVTNEGNARAVLTAITISNDFIVVSSTCGTELAPSRTCFIDVAMRPFSAGPVGGQLLVSSNAAGGAAAVELLGRGCRPFTSVNNRFGARGACSP
jgi:hypothetical protein